MIVIAKAQRYTALCIVSIFTLSLAVSQTAYDSLYLKNPVYKNLTALYELSKIEHADIVFLGNSITYGGNWAELLGRERVVNRGIGSDNLPGMLHRLPQVYRLQPKLCFLMAGINDIYADVPVDTVFTRYTQLIDSLRVKNIIPIIQSTLYVNPKWKRADAKNPEVVKLNMLLHDYTVQHGLIYIDLNVYLSENEMLRSTYTTDGVHLTPEAYKVWRDNIELIIRTFGL
jgi:lysophospholipase L1-like esterase